MVPHFLQSKTKKEHAINLPQKITFSFFVLHKHIVKRMMTISIPKLL